MDVVNLSQKFEGVKEYWDPKIIAKINNYEVKIAKITGSFMDHSHSNSDELFYVLKGEIKIEFTGKEVALKAGEMLVVPKGTVHKPVVPKGEAEIMMIELSGTVNTGDAGGDRTVEAQWI